MHDKSTSGSYHDVLLTANDEDKGDEDDFYSHCCINTIGYIK